MELKPCLLLVFVIAAYAAPVKQLSEEIIAEEGHSIPSYAAPGGYGISRRGPSPYGGGSVTSYNRRGSYTQASDFAKPSIYGTSYRSHSSIRGPGYSGGPGYVPHQQYGGGPGLTYAQSGPNRYGDYGPQRNIYSATSQHLSQDPSYDPAKDPVSQYAAYVPVREYGPKGQSSGNELSIYGYKK